MGSSLLKLIKDHKKTMHRRVYKDFKRRCMVFLWSFVSLNGLLPIKSCVLLLDLWYEFYDNGTRRDEYKKMITCLYTSGKHVLCKDV
jgi:hypothetical protein